MSSIYGEYEPRLKYVMDMLKNELKFYDRMTYEESGEHIYEHLTSRIKSDQSMREKCRKRGLPETAFSALHEMQDAIGLRVVCLFIDDVYDNVRLLKSLHS